MKEFFKIFKKVDGMNVLKQYFKAHVLVYALVQTALLGTSKKSLELVRLAVYNRIYKRLKKKNSKLIKNFKEQNADAFDRKKMNYNPVIWTIWMQGMDAAPPVVQKCYESMKRNIIDREIIVITEENYKNYVNLPNYILDKYQKGIISKTHFADILRIELLATYGGTWLDGTVYCSSYPKHKYMLDSELFAFQMMKPGLDGHTQSISSWMMSAYSNHPIILLTRELLYNYWKTYNYAIDYFIFHDFFEMSIGAYPDEWKKVIPFSNSTPQILLLRLFDKYNEEIWNALKEQTSFHKLSFKFDEEKFRQKGTYYDEIVGHSEA